MQREVLEQKARELGVTVDEDAVEALAERLEGPGLTGEEVREEGQEGEGDEEAEESEERGEKLREQIRETAHAQLLYQALYERLTRDVRVPDSAVVAYYRSHRSSYPAPPRRGNRPPPSVEESIRRGLTATARDKAMTAFVARTRREYEDEVQYRDGWSPR